MSAKRYVTSANKRPDTQDGMSKRQASILKGNLSNELLNIGKNTKISAPDSYVANYKKYPYGESEAKYMQMATVAQQSHVPNVDLNDISDTIKHQELKITAKDAIKGIEKSAQDSFMNEFKLWLAGTPSDEVRNKMGDGPSYNFVNNIPGVREFLLHHDECMIDTHSVLTSLVMSGPQTFEEAYLYFKYVIMGKPEDINGIQATKEFKHYLKRNTVTNFGDEWNLHDRNQKMLKAYFDKWESFDKDLPDNMVQRYFKASDSGTQVTFGLKVKPETVNDVKAMEKLAASAKETMEIPKIAKHESDVVIQQNVKQVKNIVEQLQVTQAQLAESQKLMEEKMTQQPTSEPKKEDQSQNVVARVQEMGEQLNKNISQLQNTVTDLQMKIEEVSVHKGNIDVTKATTQASIKEYGAIISRLEKQHQDITKLSNNVAASMTNMATKDYTKFVAQTIKGMEKGITKNVIDAIKKESGNKKLMALQQHATSDASLITGIQLMEKARNLNSVELIQSINGNISMITSSNNIPAAKYEKLAVGIVASMDVLKQKVVQAQNELLIAQEKVQSMEHTSTQKLEEYTKTKTELQEMLKMAKEKEQTMTSQLEPLIKKVAKLNIDVKTRTNEKVHLEQLLKEKQDEIGELMSSAGMQSKIVYTQGLEKDIEEMVKQESEFKLKLKEQDITIKSTKKEIEDTKKIHKQQIANEQEKHKLAAKQISDKLAKKESELKDMTKEVNELKKNTQNLANMETELQKLKAQLVAKEGKVQSTQLQAEKEKAVSQLKAQDLNNKIGNLRDQINSLKEMKKKTDKLEGEKTKLQEAVAKIIQDKTDLTVKQSKQISELSSKHQSDLAAKNKAISQLESQNKELQTKLGKFEKNKGKIKTLKDDVAKLTVKLNTKDNLIRELMGEKKKVESDIGAVAEQKSTKKRKKMSPTTEIPEIPKESHVVAQEKRVTHVIPDTPIIREPDNMQDSKLADIKSIEQAKKDLVNLLKLSNDEKAKLSAPNAFLGNNVDRDFGIVAVHMPKLEGEAQVRAKEAYATLLNLKAKYTDVNDLIEIQKANK